MTSAPSLSFPQHRPRRLRQAERLRRLVRETHLTPSSLISPLFVCAEGPRRAVPGLGDCWVQPVEDAIDEARALEAAGVGGVLLFGVASAKDEVGSDAWNADAAVPSALRALRSATPGLALWADVCLCAYTSHAHCGLISSNRRGVPAVDNDSTLPLLARVAATYADAGADVVAPSDMMDGRVGRIRAALDEKGYIDTAICSYAVKYASAFYGPFRDAAGSAPASGDRRGYQMDPANSEEALREVALDIAEGADLVMVKPALAYLDIVHQVKRRFEMPTVAYHVSGEHAMVNAAAERGWVDADAARLEILTSIRRAGADLIVTYGALHAARLLS